MTRNRLIDALTARKDRKLILVHAKPGQGKSSLIAQFIKIGKLTTVWYNMSEDDSDPILFLQLIQKALSIVQQNEVKSESKTITQAIEDFLKALDQNIKGDLYIVLDDFHRANSSVEMRELINQLLVALPQTIHLIILSREYPQLYVSRIRAEKELFEIDEYDLKFTDEEVKQLLEDVYQLKLNTNDIRSIIDICRGWVTALVHFYEAIETQNETFRIQILQNYISERRLSSLSEYFNQEVFHALLPAEQEILIKLSAFKKITATLVSALVSKEAVEILNGLVERNLFINREDSTATAYTIHPLFYRFLSDEFQSLPEEEQVHIHRTGAVLFYNDGHFKESIHHFVLGKEFDEAEKVLLEEADELLEHGQYWILHDALVTIPDELRYNNPLLLYYYAITTNLVQPFISRRTLVDLLETFRKTGDINREAKIYSVLLSNYIFYQGNREVVNELVIMAQSFIDSFGSKLTLERRITLATLISFGRWWTKPDLDDAYEIALSAEETSYKIHNEEVLIFSQIVLARIYLDRGEFEQSKETLEQTERILNRNPSLRQYEALLRFYLGDTYFYLGELSQAFDQAQKGLDKIDPGFAFCQYLKLNQVLYCLYIPELKNAETILDSTQLERIGDNFWVRYLSVYLLHMLLAYQKNNYQRTEYYCNRLMDPGNQHLLEADFPYSYLAIAEVLCYFERYQEAIDILVKLLKEAPKDKFPYPNATAYALLGLIYDKLNNKEKSKKCFKDMVGIIDDKTYNNLDICSPELLHRIAITSNLSVFKEFPRIKNFISNHRPQRIFPRLSLYTLGDFRVVLDREEIPSAILSQQKKVMDLLKLLIVHRKNGLVKEVLYNLFWPGYTQRSARNNLNTIIYRLRKILSEDLNYIVTGSGIIQLNMDVCAIDVEDFLENIKLGKQEETRGNHQGSLDFFYRAKLIYRGEFLANDLYYDDIINQRENLKSTYLRLLIKLIVKNLDASNHFEALTLAEELITKDDICEPAYRLIMIANTLMGNKNEVPRIFAKLNDRLVQEYNVQADLKTVELKDMLLRGDQPSTAMWQGETVF